MPQGVAGGPVGYHVGVATGAKDMIDVLIEDHREVEQLFRELEELGTGPQRCGQLAGVAIAELVRHSLIEQRCLYPVARDSLPDGDRIADRETDVYRQAEQAMRLLERMRPGERRFGVEVWALISLVRTHIVDQESDLFPRLRRACPRRRLTDLGEQIDRARRMAPTQRFPSARAAATRTQRGFTTPYRPPAGVEALLTLGPGLVDRLRDALAEWPPACGAE